MIGARVIAIILILLFPLPGYCEYLFFESDTATDIRSWHPESRNRCYFPGDEDADQPAAKLFNNILSYIQKDAEYSEALMKTAVTTGIAFCIENRADGSRGYYDYRYNIIAVRESLGFYQKVAIVLHELRHVEQVNRGFRQTLEYSMNEMTRMTYAVEADVQAFSVLFAWRMKKKGLPDLWHTLLTFKHYADIAKSFEQEMARSDDDMRATKQAFIQWYDSAWRKKNYRTGCCMGYLDMLDETNLIESYELLPQDFFDELCVLPDGRNYGCQFTNVIKQKS
jgi:hypothetical protein